MAPDSKSDTKQASETIIDTTESKRLDLSTIESPILVSERKKPLGLDQWKKLLDSDGRVVDESALRKAVFKGGVEKKTRKEVWRFLFGFYPFSSTSRERNILATESYLRYSALKARWKECLNSCPSQDDVADNRPAYLKEFEDCDTETDSDAALIEVARSIGQEQLKFMRLPALINASRQPIDVVMLKKMIRVVDKDVPRTDRSHPYFCGKENRNLLVVREILITYAAYHPDVGYVQGMNDLLSRFLVVLESEAEAYWCLKNYLDHIQEDFLEKGMMRKIELVNRLLKKMDPELYQHFQSHDMEDLLFVHRWLILGFKREFSFEDALTLFEIISSQHLEVDSLEGAIAREKGRKHEAENVGGEYQMEEAAIDTEFTFDLFLCVAVLKEYREKLFDCEEVSKVYNLINNLSMKMDLTVILMKAEELFYRYCRRSVVDCFQLIDMSCVAHHFTPDYKS